MGPVVGNNAASSFAMASSSAANTPVGSAGPRDKFSNASASLCAIASSSAANTPLGSAGPTVWNAAVSSSPKPVPPVVGLTAGVLFGTAVLAGKTSFVLLKIPPILLANATVASGLAAAAPNAAAPSVLNNPLELLNMLPVLGDGVDTL